MVSQILEEVGWVGGGGACQCGDPQSMLPDLSYHKEHEYIWLRGWGLIRPFMNPSWCHWMRLIRNTNIYGLGVGI